MHYVLEMLFREGRMLGSAIDTLNEQEWGTWAQRMLGFANHVRAYEPPRARGIMSPGE